MYDDSWIDSFQKIMERTIRGVSPDGNISLKVELPDGTPYEVYCDQMNPATLRGFTEQVRGVWRARKEEQNASSGSSAATGTDGREGRDPVGGHAGSGVGAVAPPLPNLEAPLHEVFESHRQRLIGLRAALQRRVEAAQLDLERARSSLRTTEIELSVVEGAIENARKICAEDRGEVSPAERGTGATGGS